MRALHGKGRIAAALAIVAALGVAAMVRPPRAAPTMRAIASVGEPTARAAAHRRPHTRPHHAHRARVPRRPRRAVRVPIEPVDLNQADAAAFERIPGIDERLAQRIVAFRALNGPFESLDELTDVDGFPVRRVDRVARYLILHRRP